MDPDNMENEFGDLFSVSSMRQDFMTSTRKMHWNIRTKSLYDDLTISNRKHYKKVKSKDMSLAEMDAIWDEAKQKGL